MSESLRAGAYGCALQPHTWHFALNHLALRTTVPLWRQAGIPQAMCDRPLTLRRTADRLLRRLLDVSEEAGTMERQGRPDVEEWYISAMEAVLKVEFDALAVHYGADATQDLGVWLSVVFERPDRPAWTNCCRRIAASRPSESLVRERIPERALVLIRGAFGPGADDALDECERRARKIVPTARDIELTPPDEDPSVTFVPDHIGFMAMYARDVRARALREVLRQVLPPAEFVALERVILEWPW